MRVMDQSEPWQVRLRGRRLGLLVNPTSVDAALQHAIDLGLAARWRVERLFGPEHGLRGEAQDMIGVDSQRDPLTGIPTVSLYGHDPQTLKPAPADLDGLDVVLIDLQDIGTRYYTFAYTAALMVEACAAQGVEAWVLDRPNPLGGEALEGNAGEDAQASFVGMYPPLVARHGLTLGELVTLLARRHGWGEALTVVPMQGWRRSMAFEDTGLPWVMPSPNMPTVDTAFVYPGQCLWEGTNLSEGRGTTRPFELFGAPWLDPAAVLAALEPAALDGCALRPLVFEPTFQKHARQPCRGFQVHVTDRSVFRSWALGLGLLKAVRSAHPEAFGWRRERYEFVSDRLAIDLLLGDTALRHALEDDVPLADLLALCAVSRRGFEEERRGVLRYGG
jgi:uncharacterized protein YbbC (DUF1343 family)